MLRICAAGSLLLGFAATALAQATLDELAWAYAISPAFPERPDA